MAEYRFQVLDIDTDLENKTVCIECSLDVDEDTVVSNVYLMQDSPRAIMPCTISVDGKEITLVLQEWPVPNCPYTLIIDDGIRSIVGDEIESALPFHITFSSAVLSKVKLLSPSNFSDIEDGDLAFSWQETGTPCTGKFYVEVGTENVFNNVVFKSVIDKSSDMTADGIYDAIIPEKKIADPGQYYMRIRAEGSDGYGEWSEIITFVRAKERPVVPNPQPKEEKIRPELPVVEDLTKEVSSDVSRETKKNPIVSPQRTVFDDVAPESFVIEFDEPIDTTNATYRVERRNS